MVHQYDLHILQVKYQIHLNPHTVLQIIDNPVFNPNDIKAPGLTKNRFSIIARKEERG